MSDYLAAVQEHVANLLGEACPPDERLFSTSRLDSVSLARIIAWLEDRYGVDVRPEDVSLAHFDTPSRVACYLEERLTNISPGVDTKLP